MAENLTHTSSEELSRQPSGRPRIGLALGSGAARGFAHLGVLRALKELELEIDVFAGTSAGAIVAASHLLGITDRLVNWAKEAGPSAAFSAFALQIARGGLISPDGAFQKFEDADCPIEALSKPFGTVATDLATGEEVWLTDGSTLEACRASSAVPMVIQAARVMLNDQERWLIDGAVSNPVPVTLARALGAERVIAVDLNDEVITLKRFDRPSTRAVVPLESPDKDLDGPSVTAPVEKFIKAQSREIAQRFALSRARSRAQPQFFETMLATLDIIQRQMGMARARADHPDIRLTPQLGFASPASIEAADEFEAEGYRAAMAQREALLALKSPSTDQS